VPFVAVAAINAKGSIVLETVVEVDELICVVAFESLQYRTGFRYA
jgi:hypothetical protein